MKSYDSVLQDNKTQHELYKHNHPAFAQWIDQRKDKIVLSEIQAKMVDIIPPGNHPPKESIVNCKQDSIPHPSFDNAYKQTLYVPGVT